MKEALAWLCLGLLFVALVVLAYSYKEPLVTRTKEEVEWKGIQATTGEVIGKIQYIKDTRTDLCFAYYWGGAADGGPALATVSCEVIPSQLLMVAKIPSPTKKR